MMECSELTPHFGSTTNGPNAMKVLAQCTDAKLDNANFRWLTAQQIKVAGYDVWAYLEFELDGVEDGHGGEAVIVDGKVVGSTVSVAYSHTYGKILALAFLQPHVAVQNMEITVIVAGKPRKGRTW